MTVDEIITYYANLLIIQYRQKAKAYATIQAVVQPVIMDNLPLQVQAAFSVDSAIGVQLDILGKYVGASRTNLTFSGQVTLGDGDFRTLVRLKIVQNNSGSSLKDIQTLLSTFLPGAFLVFDYKDMTMGYVFSSIFGTRQLAEIFVRQGLLPKPMGVQLKPLIYGPNIDRFFGFRTYDEPGFNNTGFNTYSDYEMNRPWLTYADAVIF